MSDQCLLLLLASCPDYMMSLSTAQQAPKYYELMGYTEEPLPPFTPYAPPMLDQPLMAGAIEEQQGPHPTGLVPDLSEWLAMPDSCLLRSQADLPIGAAQYLATPSHALTTHKHQVRKPHRKLDIAGVAASCISDHKPVGKEDVVHILMLQLLLLMLQRQQ